MLISGIEERVSLASRQRIVFTGRPSKITCRADQILSRRAAPKGVALLKGSFFFPSIPPFTPFTYIETSPYLTLGHIVPWRRLLLLSRQAAGVQT